MAPSCKLPITMGLKTNFSIVVLGHELQLSRSYSPLLMGRWKSNGLLRETNNEDLRGEHSLFATRETRSRFITHCLHLPSRLSVVCCFTLFSHSATVFAPKFCRWTVQWIWFSRLKPSAYPQNPIIALHRSSQMLLRCEVSFRPLVLFG